MIWKLFKQLNTLVYKSTTTWTEQIKAISIKVSKAVGILK